MPVTLLDASGGITTGHAGLPCIRLRYSFRPPEIVGNETRLYELRDAWALLDTGADWNLIYADLIPTDNPAIDRVISRGIGGKEHVNNHRVWFHFDSIDLSQATGIMAMKRGAYSPYDLILGRKFLQTTRFVYDLVRGVTLDYIGVDHAL
jgi:hypothetical protein